MTANCPECGKPVGPNALEGLCPECLMKIGLGSQVAGAPVGGAAPEGDQAGGTASGFTPASLAELAPHFPQLEILELLGRGGMGAVYKARQKNLDRLVALKILPLDIGRDPAFAERFAREAKALAKLNHPGVVTLYEFGQTAGLFYFLMELVDGVNLRQLLAASRLAPREALAIVPQICDALQYAHDQGIVHRDIKPENILLDRQGRVKVADFGLAKLVAAGAEAAEGTGVIGAATTLTEAGRVMGTPRYMAPEQSERPLEVDHRADIYSLGVVIYQMLTGELPGRPIEPPSRKVQLDVRLDEVVLRALEKQPELRYQQASQIRDDIETIAESPPPSPGEIPPLITVPDAGTPGKRPAHLRARRSSSHRAQAIAAGVGLTVMICLWGTMSYLVFVFPRHIAVYQELDVPLTAVQRVIVNLSQFLQNAGFFLVPTLMLFTVGALIWLIQSVARLRRERAKEGAARPPGSGNPRSQAGDWPTRCLAGVVLLLPPVLCAWFVLAGHSRWGVDLDADVQFVAGLVGFPVCAAIGAALAWWFLQRKTQGAGVTGEQPRRWSMLAVAAVTLLVLSLPPGGGSLVALDLIHQDPDWNPGRAEAVFTFLLFGATLLFAVAATLLGALALRQMKRKMGQFRGGWAAHAATVFWPGSLVLLGLMILGAPSEEADLVVTGTVTDAVTGKPIPWARVADHVYDADAGRRSHEAWTDAEGGYKLLTWDEEHTLAASAPGYEPQLAVLTTKLLGGEREQRLDFELQPLWHEFSFDSPGTAKLLDLDTGRLVDPPSTPPRRERDAFTWFAASGADLGLGYAGARMGCVTALANELKLAHMEETSWATTVRDIDKVLAARSSGMDEMLDEADGWKAFHFPTNGGSPLVLAFKTAQGTKGVLEFTRFPTNREDRQTRMVVLRFRTLTTNGSQAAGLP